MDLPTAEGRGTTGAGDNQAGPGNRSREGEESTRVAVPPSRGTEQARDQGGMVT